MDTTQRRQQIRARLASLTPAQAKDALEAVLDVAESAEETPDAADFHGREIDEVWAEHEAKKNVAEDVLYAMESGFGQATGR
ncbi:hypothetical protein ACFVV7_35580 [Streptomyces globisporus]|uniref:hypothetical protein n=1 Tax=Streptomyces globisporus TaxID=1908 RepID=UPI0036DEDE56